jgi:hypothetical protein
MELRAPGQHREIRVRRQEENAFALTIMFFPGFSADLETSDAPLTDLAAQGLTVDSPAGSDTAARKRRTESWEPLGIFSRKSSKCVQGGEPILGPPRVQLSNCNPGLLTAPRPIEQINRDPRPPSAPARLHAGTQTAQFLASWSAWRGPAWSPDGTRQSLSSAGRQSHPEVL